MKPTPRFIHTHLHCHMSVLDAIGKPDDYCKTAAELGFKAIAVTDHGTIDSFYDWQWASEKHNIKVIFGCELYLVENTDWRPTEKKEREKRGHCCVWISNETGYRNLLKILSFANVHGFYYRPRCSFDFLYENCEGLIIGTACTSSFINLPNGVGFLEKISKKVPTYLEVMGNSFDEQSAHNIKCLELSKQLNLPLLASHDVHYVHRINSRDQEVLLCIQSKDKMDNPDRWKFGVDDLYLCDANYIAEKFKEQGVLSEVEYTQAMKNTNEIAKQCNFKMKRQSIKLPIPPQYEGMDENKVFYDLCLEGLKDRFDGKEIPQNYLERLDMEYEVIRDNGFVRYFLIVADILDYCHKSSIMIGPRGSAAGCLISYALRIIHIDPIEHSLIFERFLSKYRVSPPDIDLDIEDRKRHLLVERLRTLYGEKKVAAVSTFLKMEARGIIRDVSRVYDVPLDEVGKFAKIIDTTIDDAILNTEEGKEFYSKYPEIIDICKNLQGQVKGYSKHAAGVVLSSFDLDQGENAHVVERKGSTLINWSKDDAEYAGLIKFDFLGLAMLSVLSETIKLVKQNHGKDIDLYKINMADKEVFKDISAGNTVGLFQISTFLLTKMIKEMKVENINQLSDVLALVRPGPLETTTPIYLSRKKGEKWEPSHPIFEDITKDTYGVCCYQEQIMFVFNKIAGLHLSVCDEIRRVIGKKRDSSEFEKYREDFVLGCKKMGTFAEDEARNFFDNLASYARYGFNRSHSLSYAFVAYFSAWLKFYYPVEYLCSVLSFGNDDKTPIIKEALRLGLSIQTPRLETSDANNWVAREGKLYIPFKEVKGLGPKTLETIQQYQQSTQSGFFQTEKPIIKGKLLTILTDIGAFTEQTPDTINQYFSLGISLTPETTYKKLFDLIKDTEYAQYNINDLLTGNFKNGKFAREIKDKTQINGLFQCCACELRSGCDKPSLPSIGDFNVAILLEKPDWNEKNDLGILFKEMKKYGFQEGDFTISHTVKCGSRGKINKDHISVCSNKWLDQELKETRFVLAFGNAGVLAFHDGEEKISKLNGTCSWNESIGAWVVYVINPGWVSWKPEEFRGRFKEGIKNFVGVLENCGGFV